MSALLQKIRSAERSVQSAAILWTAGNAVDLRVMGNCLSALENSVADLNEIALNQIEAGEVIALRDSALNIKEAAARLGRLVDSSSALLRNLPGFESENAGIYEADGLIRQSAPDAGEIRA